VRSRPPSLFLFLSLAYLLDALRLELVIDSVEIRGLGLPKSDLHVGCRVEAWREGGGEGEKEGRREKATVVSACICILFLPPSLPYLA
jgi:hypothetical protein